MGKRRNDISNDSPMRKKFSPNNSSPSTSRQGQNMLNNSLMSLYRGGRNESASNGVQVQQNNSDKVKEIVVENSKTPKTTRRGRNLVLTPIHPSTTFKNVGGMDSILEDLADRFYYFKHPELAEMAEISRAILLTGPSGSGKSHLARSIAGQFKLPLIQIHTPELVRGVAGESESKIRDAFDAAISCGRCVLFFDKIEAICPKKEVAETAMITRMVTQMTLSIDDLYTKDKEANVTVIAATNMPESLDPALRMQFDEIAIGIPNQEARLRILQVLCQNVTQTSSIDFHWLSHNTPGYVAGDLRKLFKIAGKVATKRVCHQLRVASKKNDISKRQENCTNADSLFKIDANPSTDATNSECESPCIESNAALVSDNPIENSVNRNDNSVDQPTISEVAADDSNKPNDVLKEASTSIPTQTSKETVLKDAGTPIPTKTSKEIDQTVENVQKKDSMTVENVVDLTQPEEVDLTLAETVDLTHEMVDLTAQDGIQSKENEDSFSDVDVIEEAEPPSHTWVERIDYFENKEPEEVENMNLTMGDFRKALKRCVPYAKREGIATIPEVTWNDIGALEDIKRKLRETILWPVLYEEQFKLDKVSTSRGVLLYGPKGCGKTLLAKAVANECKINFLSVQGPELLNMYVGESERGIRKVFERARSLAPCVIFFDEIDAVCPPRSMGSSKENGPTERIVNQLLVESDGFNDRHHVFLVAATNRLDKIDSAMLRPGRLEKVIYVGLPTPEERVLILNTICRHKKLESGLTLSKIATDFRATDYSGADLKFLVEHAYNNAMREWAEFQGPQTTKSSHNLVLCQRHFDAAFKEVKPSLSKEDKQYFEYINQHYR